MDPSVRDNERTGLTSGVFNLLLVLIDATCLAALPLSEVCTSTSGRKKVDSVSAVEDARNQAGIPNLDEWKKLAGTELQMSLASRTELH